MYAETPDHGPLTSYMNKKAGPPAPTSAVGHIIAAFNGLEEVGGTDGWLVTFPDAPSTERATLLISMLRGWKAEDHPNILHMIRISGE